MEAARPTTSSSKVVEATNLLVQVATEEGYAHCSSAITVELCAVPWTSLACNEVVH